MTGLTKRIEIMNRNLKKINSYIQIIFAEYRITSIVEISDTVYQINFYCDKCHDYESVICKYDFDKLIIVSNDYCRFGG